MVRLALAGITAAAIVGVLLRDAFDPPGPSLLLLLIAFVSLGLLVAAEVRRPRLDRRAVLGLRARSAAALALLALNPVVIVSVVNGGHNDALVGLGVLGGVLLAERRPLVAGLVLGAAALIKAAALLPLAVVAVWVWRRRGWRA